MKTNLILQLFDAAMQNAKFYFLKMFPVPMTFDTFAALLLILFVQVESNSKCGPIQVNYNQAIFEKSIVITSNYDWPNARVHCWKNGPPNYYEFEKLYQEKPSNLRFDMKFYCQDNKWVTTYGNDSICQCKGLLCLGSFDWPTLANQQPSVISLAVYLATPPLGWLRYKNILDKREYSNEETRKSICQSYDQNVGRKIHLVKTSENYENTMWSVQVKEIGVENTKVTVSCEPTSENHRLMCINTSSGLKWQKIMKTDEPRINKFEIGIRFKGSIKSYWFKMSDREIRQCDRLNYIVGQFLTNNVTPNPLGEPKPDSGETCDFLVCLSDIKNRPRRYVNNPVEKRQPFIIDC